MVEIANPYIAGGPVTSLEMFFGRDDVYTFIEEYLNAESRDSLLVLYGSRCIGKTSVLYQMERFLDPRYLCIYFNLHNLHPDGSDGLLWELASWMDRILTQEFQLLLPGLERSEFMEDAHASFETAFLDRIWQLISNHSLLLMLDGAEHLIKQVHAGTMESEIFDYFLDLQQSHPRLNFLFTLEESQEAIRSENALLSSIALPIKIPNLDRQSATDLIKRPVEQVFQVDEEAVEHILDITAGHPYYIQMACNSLFDYCQANDISTVGVQEVNSILEDLVERGSSTFESAWEESTAIERAVLVAMAFYMGEYNRPVRVLDVHRTWLRRGVFIPWSDIALAIKKLHSQEVITGSNSFRFSLDLYRMWVKKYRWLGLVQEEIEDEARLWSRREIPKEQPARTSWYRSRAAALSLVGLIVTICAFTAILYTGVFNPSTSALLAPQELVWDGDVSSQSVVFSPDGQYIAARDGSQVYIWPLSGLQQELVLSGHDSEVQIVAFNYDSSLLVSAASSDFIVWDVATGQQLAMVGQEVGEQIVSLAWSPDGGFLATADTDNIVRLWDTGDWKRVQDFSMGEPGQPAEPFMIFNADGSLLLVRSNAGVRAWALDDMQEINVAPQSSGDIRVLAASTVDPNLFASAGDKEITIWRLGIDEPVARLMVDHPVENLAFNSSGTLLAASFDIQDSILIWNTGDWEIAYRAQIEDLETNFVGFHFNSESNLLAVSDENKVWTLRLPVELASLPTLTPGPSIPVTGP